MRPACTHESHAAAKANFASSPELVFKGLQFFEGELCFVYVDCVLCQSTLSVSPDAYAAAMVGADMVVERQREAA